MQNGFDAGNLDALGLQAVKVAEPDKGVQVWSKPLTGAGTRAVLLLNRTAAPAEVKVAWKDIGIVEASQATVKDLWSGKDLGSFKAAYSTPVPAADAALLLIKGTDVPSTGYRPEPPGADPCRGCELRFAHVAARAPWSRLRITYRNSGDAPRYADLRINGQDPTAIVFPPTGPGAGDISVMARLDRPGATNILRFSAETDLTPVIDAINVE